MSNKQNKIKLLGNFSIFMGIIILLLAGFMIFTVIKENPKNYVTMGAIAIAAIVIFNFYIFQKAILELFVEIEDNTKMSKMNTKNSNKLEKDILEVLESIDFLAIRRNKTTRELFEEMEKLNNMVKKGAFRVAAPVQKSAVKDVEKNEDENFVESQEPIVAYETEYGGASYIDEEPETKKEEIYDERAIRFADPNLESAVREKINKMEGPIYSEDVADISTLSLSNKNISTLEGIENLVGLQKLDLWKTDIDNIEPLSTLENIVYLRISKTRVTDITPLENLTAIEELYLQETDIENIKVLSKLENLMYLYLEKTLVKDISALENLKNLEDLYLWNTPNLDTSTSSPVHKTIKKLEANGCNVIY